MAISSVSSSTAPVGAAAAASGSDAAALQDRFLKLLVAQVNSQDPMNPMDNAQMTSQMAQINTVSGIQQLNETMKSMAQQFSSLQVLQGASMVGHAVLTEGNALVPDATGVARGAIDLAGNADSVKVDIYSSGGQLIDSINAGAQQAGRSYFAWDTSQYQGAGTPTFKVTAMGGGKVIGATTLMQNTVTSVGSDNGTMSVQLQGRTAIAYSDIKAIL